LTFKWELNEHIIPRKQLLTRSVIKLESDQLILMVLKAQSLKTYKVDSVGDLLCILCGLRGAKTHKGN